MANSQMASAEHAAPAPTGRFSLPALLLPALLGLYLVIGALYAGNTPAWQVPDEPAHYNYVAQVANNGCCPTIEAGDWDNAYLEAIKAARFDAAALNGRFGTIQYEDHQPPLYYVLAAVVYRVAAANRLAALRLFSLALGACLGWAAWRVARLTFPARPWLALGTAGFVLFLPQHLAMMSGVNNDALAELLAALLLLACLRHVQADDTGPGAETWRAPFGMGVLLGLAFLTKLTVYPMAAVVLLAIWLRARRHPGPGAGWRGALRDTGLALLTALLLAAPFWLRNIATYGWPDFLAQAAHDRVVVGQLQAATYMEAHGVASWLRDGAQTFFQSFWGQFGWMGVPMTPTIYRGLVLFSLLALSGALVAFWRVRRMLSVVQRDMLLLCLAACALTTGVVIYYNLRFVQFQGRYLYPALIPIALMVSAGLAEWARRAELAVGRFLPRLTARAALVPLSMVALAGGMAVFALVALYRILVPGLA